MMRRLLKSVVWVGLVVPACAGSGCASSGESRNIVDRIPVGMPADEAVGVLKHDGFTLMRQSPGLIYGVQGADPVFGSSRQVNVRLTLDSAGRVATRQAYTTVTGS